MKKITCNSCSNIWYLEDNAVEKLRVCPFCEKPVREKAGITKADSLDKAIYLTIHTIGETALDNPSRIGGCLCDIAPQLGKELRILSRSFPEEYFSLVRKAWSAELAEAERLMKQLTRRLMEDEGLSESWSDQISRSYLSAIRYSRGIGMSEKLLLKVEEFRIATAPAPSAPPKPQPAPAPKIQTPQPAKQPASQKPAPAPSSATFSVSNGTLMLYTGSDKVVTIPRHVTSIGIGAFKKNAYIEKVIIPGNVGTVQASAFAGCSRLREVEIQEGVKGIERWAFADCSALESVSLAATAWQVSLDAFNGCPNLRKMTLMSLHHLHTLTRVSSLQDVYTSDSLAFHFRSRAKEKNIRLHTI